MAENNEITVIFIANPFICEVMNSEGLIIWEGGGAILASLSSLKEDARPFIKPMLCF
jgi:hypothetical protein